MGRVVAGTRPDRTRGACLGAAVAGSDQHDTGCQQGQTDRPHGGDRAPDGSTGLGLRCMCHDWAPEGQIRQ
jgi:hypothetical protein